LCEDSEEFNTVVGSRSTPVNHSRAERPHQVVGTNKPRSGGSGRERRGPGLRRPIRSLGEDIRVAQPELMLGIPMRKSSEKI